jgi:hypothetical protein
MNATSVEMISVKTRSGKNDAIQKRKIMSPKKAITFTSGLLCVEVDKCIG